MGAVREFPLAAASTRPAGAHVPRVTSRTRMEERLAWITIGTIWALSAAVVYILWMKVSG